MRTLLYIFAICLAAVLLFVTVNRLERNRPLAIFTHAPHSRRNRCGRSPNLMPFSVTGAFGGGLVTAFRRRTTRLPRR